MMSAKPVLQVQDLRTYFRTREGTARAVDGVSFSIDAGETYALVGESGCGKSVTALSILQLVARPAGYIAGGSIRLGDQEITSLPAVAMRAIRGNRVSMIFQEPMTALNPVFTTGDQIAEAILLHQKCSRAEARKRGIDMLEKVGIPDPAARYNEYPHQMSGGMRQRVMIAMALSCQPELLIADEPTTALDVTIQSQILELIRELKEELGTAVLLITHDMGVVRENAQRVGVMYAGKLVESASMKQLFATPAHPYTRLLLRSIPSRTVHDRALATIAGMVPKATDQLPGCRFSNRCPFVMDRCGSGQPPAYEIGAAHHAACFLLDPEHPGDTRALVELPAKPIPLVDTTAKRLEIRGLTMHFPIRKGLLKRVVGHVKAVDGVDLTIHKGEALALVGESGCGKTTVGKCIIQLLKATAGSIRYQDAELVGLGRKKMKPFRRRIQMIFQDPFSSLNPRHMIRETLMEGLTTHGIGRGTAEREKRAIDLVRRTGLDPAMLDRYPHEFSGGQRQRIGLARALAVEPELLVCDEATSSLDVSVQAQILNLLKQLQSDLGLAYLFITHDLSVVKYLSDRVCVMYLGKIVEKGVTRDIFERPRHPYTRALLSAIPEIDDTGRKRIVLGGDVPSPVNPPPGCAFHPRCPYAEERCRHTPPELDGCKDGSPGSRVACLRREEIG